MDVSEIVLLIRREDPELGVCGGAGDAVSLLVFFFFLPDGIGIKFSYTFPNT